MNKATVRKITMWGVYIPGRKTPLVCKSRKQARATARLYNQALAKMKKMEKGGT